MTSRKAAETWLLLIHQLAARPAYERVKLWRRLQDIGAVAVKKTVYALPATEDAREDFLWTAKQIEAAGGEALVCEARFVAGVSDAQLRALFDAARDTDYRAVAAEARALTTSAPRRRGKRTTANLRTSAARLRRRLEAIQSLDHFGADSRIAAHSAVKELEVKVMKIDKPAVAATDRSPADRQWKGRVWVTRRHVRVDRIACAWLIRRFIDPKARFRFVESPPPAQRRNELRFDMAEADFTHRGDRCSFEVLLEESRLRDPALRAIGEIVHDLDLKDGKYARPEAGGVRQLIDGITLKEGNDKARIARGSELLDDLYRSLRAQPAKRKPQERSPRKS